MAARTVWCRACGSVVPFSLQGCVSCGAGLLKAGETFADIATEPPAEAVVAVATRPKRGEGRKREHG